MAQYLLLIYEDETIQKGYDEAQNKQLFADYMAFTEELKKAGAMVAGDALQPVSTARTVRVRDGKPLATDGPFAETKEQLGGYYLIEADSTEKALEWAAKIPSAKVGSIEVRPVMVFEGM